MCHSTTTPLPPYPMWKCSCVEMIIPRHNMFVLAYVTGTNIYTHEISCVSDIYTHETLGVTCTRCGHTRVCVLRD